MKKAKLATWIGLFVSAAVIAFLLYSIDFAAALAAIRSAELGPVLLATLLYSSLFLLRGLRWRVMLEPLVKVSVRETSEVFLIGIMANNVLPARLGDVARAFVLAKKKNVPASATFANVMLERIFDGVAVVLLLDSVLWLAPPESPVVRSLGVLMALVFVGAISVCTCIALFEARFMATVHAIVSRLPARAAVLERLVEKLATGLHTLKSGRATLQVALLSLLIWTLEAAVYWVLQSAFGLTLPFSAMIVVMSTLTLGLTAPSGPGFVGVFEWLILTSLAWYGVGAPLAPAFALVLHTIHYVPGTVLGLLLSWKSGIQIGQIQAAAHAPSTAQSAVEEGASVV